MLIRKLLAGALALALVSSLASAQDTGGTMSSGQIMIGQSDGNVAPKSLSGDVTNDAAGVTAIGANKVTTSKILDGNVTNAKLATGAANTFKASLNGSTTSDVALTACTLSYQVTKWVSGTGWQCGLNPVLPSRTIAATLDLSAFSVIMTQGYATAGDGGGATFQKQAVGTSFIDQNLASAPCTIAGGSAYTNGTYFGVPLTGGSGVLAYGVFTIAGGAVTAVDVTYSPGNKYKVGDVLSASPASIGGTGSGFTCTVNAIVTAKASFNDSASSPNPWQFVVDSGGMPNTKQFGAKIDGTTDDFASIQSSLFFANYSTNPAVGGVTGYWGGRVYQPKGASNICGPTNVSLVVPQGVNFMGAGNYASILGMCGTFFAATHFVELCDPNTHFACFDARIEAMGLIANRTQAANANIAMVHSNNTQHSGGATHIQIQAGNRGCFFYQKGYGGASYVTIEDIECGFNGSNYGIRIGDTTASGMNVTGVVFDINKFAVGGPSTAPLAAQAAFLVNGGLVQIRNGHGEQIPAGIVVDSQGGSLAATMVKISNVNFGSGTVTCTGQVQLNGTNTSGNIVMEMIPGASCTNIVSNGMAGGVSYNTNIVQQVKFTPNAVTF
ncbi:hypothetical protein PMI42_06243 [Bradyrhizobium sp. YR681]|uniref:hypothetical protein n=1 Tax=Bradyrhizobium sp. YR681 TaxID=1144344 RepID=UPI00026FB9F9|nr:hypothetical protein [Bradyrhizobium sp. YR681]EJN10467.1 hypothetical protein PMI42_06243 [Bradyrhizobium sp. YR681]